MKDFNRGGGGRFGGSNRFDNSRGPRFGDRSSRPSMHSAVCAECGQSCEVPFKPTGDKPVYCSSCFGKKAGFDNNRFDRRDSERPSFSRDNRRDSGRPSFSREDRGDRSSFAGHDNNKQQFELLNAKLDNIIRLLTAKPLVDKTFEKIIKKEEDLVVPEIKKSAKKEAKVKKTVAPKKAAKKTVVKKKK